MNTSSVAITMNDGSSGVVLKMSEPEDINQVSFAYANLTDSMNVSALFLFDLHTLSAEFQGISDFRVAVCFLDVMRCVYHLH